MLKIYRRFAACLLCIFLLPLLAARQQVSLTILHTNDTHGHLMPFSYPSMVPDGSELAALKVRSDIGGIARRATLVNRLRRELEPSGTTVWMIDAGDFSDGTPFSIEFHGEADIEAMNALGYTFATLGNHELNNPLARLRNLLRLAKYPVLCANVTETATGKPLVQPSEVRQVGPLKIGLFGLLTREAATYPAARDGLTVAGEIETARRMAAALHPQADIIIAISHSGDDLDEKIAASVPQIDVIVGGHSHSRLPVGDFVWHSKELKADEVNGTIIVQAHQWGGELGQLDLQFGPNASGAWRVERYRAQLIPVTAEIPEDKDVAAVVDRYWKQISARYGEIIGEAAEDFVERGDDPAPYNLCADAIRDAFGTEIELENMGGVRSPLIKGKITRGAVADMDPFANTIVTFKVTGRQLKEILLKERPAVSGLRYRIVNGEIRELTVSGQPIDEKHTYTGATNSYFAGVALKGIEVTDTKKPRLDVIIEYIRKKGTIYPSYDSRRVVSGQ
jgi:5'-nucleotidase